MSSSVVGAEASKLPPPPASLAALRYAALFGSICALEISVCHTSPDGYGQPSNSPIACREGFVSKKMPLSFVGAAGCMAVIPLQLVNNAAARPLKNTGINFEAVMARNYATTALR